MSPIAALILAVFGLVGGIVCGLTASDFPQGTKWRKIWGTATAIFFLHALPALLILWTRVIFG